MFAATKVKLLTSIFLLIGLSGCAFGNRQTILSYPPGKASETVSAAQAAATPTGKGRQIVLMPFTDVRTEQRFVGEVRNGYGMHTADVAAVNNVPNWISEAVKTELTAAGYSVITPESADNTASVSVLSGEITRVYCDMYLTYKGEVNFLASVRKDKTDILYRPYSGKGSAGVVWGATGESFGQSLALALSDAIKQLLADLDNVLR
jgi:hypothetical protein